MHVRGDEDVRTVDATLDEVVQHGREQRQAARLGRSVAEFVQDDDRIRRGRVKSGIYLERRDRREKKKRSASSFARIFEENASF